VDGMMDVGRSHRIPSAQNTTLVNVRHPFFLFYSHHLGIFPRLPPTRVGRRLRSGIPTRQI